MTSTLLPKQACLLNHQNLVMDTSYHQAEELLYDATLRQGLRTGNKQTCFRFHHLLYSLNQKRFAINACDTPLIEQEARTLCTRLETLWLEIEREKIADEWQAVPTNPAEFIPWFESLEQTGYGQHHPLFNYLAERARREEVRYFLQQEYSTEAGFDDLVALTQIKAPAAIKMELAHNYWDEMGRGNPKGVHSFLLQRISDHFALASESGKENIQWAPLALSNLMIAFASSRCLFHQSMGALGVIELTAPSRCVKVMQALKRVGVTSEEYHYYTLHASLDRKHWAGWRDNALRHLIRETPDSMPAIAEGALLRLFLGKQCFDLYSEIIMPDGRSHGSPA